MQIARGCCYRNLRPERTWMAVMSDSNTNAKDRLTLSSMPLVNTKGTPIFSAASSLFSNSALSVPISFDENGIAIPLLNNNTTLQDTWTGTQTNGNTSGNGTCSSFWTNASSSGQQGQPGDSQSTDGSVWVESGVNATCNLQLHIFCIEF